MNWSKWLPWTQEEYDEEMNKCRKEKMYMSQQEWSDVLKSQTNEAIKDQNNNATISGFLGEAGGKRIPNAGFTEIDLPARPTIHIAKNQINGVNRENKEDILCQEYQPQQAVGVKPALSATLPSYGGDLCGSYPSPTVSLISNEEHGWIQLFSGKKFFPLKPRIEDICIRDIAHGLSNMCRFAGQSKTFYSVAQHSVLVSYMSGASGFHGLIHDSSEGLGLMDIPSPVKKMPQFAGYREAENVLQTMIYQKFGLDPNEPKEVKLADIRVLATEARDLKEPRHPDWKSLGDPYPFTITPLSPIEAEKLFLDRFSEMVLLHSNNDYALLGRYLKE